MIACIFYFLLNWKEKQEISSNNQSPDLTLLTSKLTPPGTIFAKSSNNFFSYSLSVLSLSCYHVIYYFRALSVFILMTDFHPPPNLWFLSWVVFRFYVPPSWLLRSWVSWGPSDYSGSKGRKCLMTHADVVRVACLSC